MKIPRAILILELLQQSRRPGSYWMRVLSAGMLVALTGMVWMTGSMAIRRGDMIFQMFHLCLFGAIWVAVPLMVADGLSRERREGTLGLLFLTPLTPIQIVIAKCLADALRALCFLAACLPVMVITLLQGGVSVDQVVMSLIFLGAALAWSLGAGLLASSQCKSMQRAMGLSMIWAVVGFMIMATLSGLVLVHHTPYGNWLESYRGGFGNWAYLWEQGVSWYLHPSLALYDRATRFAGSAPNSATIFLLLKMGAIIWGISGLALLGAIRLAARTIRKRWQEEPPSAARQQIQHAFCRPRVATGFYRWWLRRKLDLNPIGWLDQRTWQARIVMWIWLAVLVSVYSTILASGTGFIRGFAEWQRVLALLLLTTLAGTSAGSFHRERESGVLELLLVAPLSLRAILWGRLRGLWGQFALALMMVVVVWIHMTFAVGDMFLRRSTPGLEFLRCATLIFGFICVPMVGLYFSLRLKNHLSAFAWTFGVAVVLPISVGMIAIRAAHASFRPARYGRYGATGDETTYALLAMGLPSLLLAAISAAALVGLTRSLQSRRYVTHA